MVGLAKALAEAVESRDRVRLQYVCARNALQLNKASRTARDRLGTVSETTAESAESLAAKAAEIDTSAPPPTTEPPPAPTLAEAAAEVRLAQGAPEDEVVQEEDYKQKALQLYGSLREKVVTYASTGAEYVRERLPDQVPERQRVIAMAQKGATIVASLGLRVASVAATGSARLQADEESVENAEKLVRDLAEQFDAADARLRADALKLKATWDDLQLQAYDAFVRGEASRGDETSRGLSDDGRGVTTFEVFGESSRIVLLSSAAAGSTPPLAVRFAGADPSDDDASAASSSLVGNASPPHSPSPPPSSSPSSVASSASSSASLWRLD